MLRAPLLLTFLLMSWLIPIGLAQETAQRFEVKTELTSEIEPPQVGSKVIYTVHISWWGTEDQKIKLIPPHIDTKGLTVENTGVSTESVPAEDGKTKQIRSFVFELVPNEKGEVSIDPFPVEYLEQGASGTKTIEVPGRTFKVKGLPIRIPWLWIASGAGLIALLSLTIFTTIRLRKRKIEMEIATDPHAIALEKVLELDSLIKKGEYPEYIAKLAREFSIYLRNVHKLESTDYGIIEKNSSLSKEDKQLLVKIIEEMTELKYSKEALSHLEVKEIKRLVEQFIESKKIV